MQQRGWQGRCGSAGITPLLTGSAAPPLTRSPASPHSQNLGFLGSFPQAQPPMPASCLPSHHQARSETMALLLIIPQPAVHAPPPLIQPCHSRSTHLQVRNHIRILSLIVSQPVVGILPHIAVHLQAVGPLRRQRRLQQVCRRPWGQMAASCGGLWPLKWCCRATSTNQTAQLLKILEMNPPTHPGEQPPVRRWARLPPPPPPAPALLHP